MTGLLDAMQAFLERTGMPHTRLGSEALGEPTFFLRVMRGRVPRLGTADRVLAYMGREPLGPRFRREVEAFLAVTRTKPHVLGSESVRDPSFVARLRRGKNPRLDTVARVRAWMEAHSSREEKRALRAMASEPGPKGGADDSCPAVSADSAGSVQPTSKGKRSEMKPMQDMNRMDRMDRMDRMNRNDRNDRNVRRKGMGAMRPMTDGAGKEEPVYLDTRAAAAFLSLSPRTLDRYRERGEGPAFHRFGARIRYLKSDVAAWASARRVGSGPKPGPGDGDD